jgi:hypothetical protein
MKELYTMKEKRENDDLITGFQQKKVLEKTLN